MNLKRAANSALSVTLIIFLSKMFGFVREIIGANYFGTGMEKAAYDSAYSLFYLPILLFSSCITSTVVPLYVHEKTNNSLKDANRFASNVTNLAGVLSLIVGIAMIVFAEPLVKLIYGGFAGEKLDMTVKLTQIMLTGLMFFVVAVVLTSILNARGQFMAAQLTGFPLSFCSILATMLFAGTHGVVAVAWSVVISGVLQIVIMLPFLRKDFTYSPRIQWKDPRVRRLIELAVPAMLAMAVSEINHMIDRSLASGLNGPDIPAMNYAFKLITFILGVIVVPITTMAFSKMSRMVSQKNSEGMIATLRESIEQASFMLLPICAICVVLAQDIIRAAYMRGEFGAESLAVTSGVFQYYVIGIIAFGLRDVFNRAFQAHQDNVTPLYVSIGTVITNVILNLILRKYMGVYGLALATSISATLGASVLFFLLRKKLGHINGKSMLEELLKIAVATVIGTIAAIALNHFLPAWTGPFMRFVRLFCAGGISVAVYLAACIVLRSRQMRSIWKVFLRGK